MLNLKTVCVLCGTWPGMSILGALWRAKAEWLQSHTQSGKFNNPPQKKIWGWNSMWSPWVQSLVLKNKILVMAEWAPVECKRTQREMVAVGPGITDTNKKVNPLFENEASKCYLWPGHPALKLPAHCWQCPWDSPVHTGPWTSEQLPRWFRAAHRRRQKLIALLALAGNRLLAKKMFPKRLLPSSRGCYCHQCGGTKGSVGGDCELGQSSKPCPEGQGWGYVCAKGVLHWCLLHGGTGRYVLCPRSSAWRQGLVLAGECGLCLLQGRAYWAGYQGVSDVLGPNLQLALRARKDRARGLTRELVWFFL